MKFQKYKLKKKKEKKTQNFLLKSNLFKSLNVTPLYDELISLGAFVGDHSKWTHFSQNSFILGYRNNYSFYNIEHSIKLLNNATRFLKKVSVNSSSKFVFVGNPEESEEQISVIFNKINKKFFPNDKWVPGFFSRKPSYSNYVLVIYNINMNSIAFNESVNAGIPVVGFATPSCDIRGVDYPVILNLKNNKMWYSNYCRALFI